MYRRDFLQTMGAGLLSLPLLAAEQAAPQRIGLNSYCLRALKWRDREVLEYAAKLKLDAVFLQDSTDPQVNELAHWTEMGKVAKDLGLHIETGVGPVLPNAEHDVEQCRQQLRLGIARAKAIGSPLVRCLHAGDREHLPAGSMEQHREQMVKLLTSMRSETTDAGLKFAIENHKDLQAWEMRAVIEAAGKDFVGSYLDTGNPVFVMEDPMTTLEVLGPYALTVHLRDSAIYQDERGAMVQWVPLGEGCIDFRSFTAKLHAINPDVFVYIKPITGRPAQLIPYLEKAWWRLYPDARASEFSQFVALAHRGEPYNRPMVIEDLPGRRTPEQFVPAIQYQQREHMERSVAYAKGTLGLGRRWRNQTTA